MARDNRFVGDSLGGDFELVSRGREEDEEVVEKRKDRKNEKRKPNGRAL